MNPLHFSYAEEASFPNSPLHILGLGAFAYLGSRLAKNNPKATAGLFVSALIIAELPATLRWMDETALDADERKVEWEGGDSPLFTQLTGLFWTSRGE